MNKVTKLKKAAKVVGYELQMFEMIYNNYLAKPRNIKTQFDINILLESFIIHAYCLYRFFYQGEKEKKNGNTYKRKIDDIIAEDFNINHGKFLKNRTPKNKLKIIEKKRNKQLAHLTYNHIYRNSKTKPFKTDVIYKGLNKTMWAFFNSLTDESKKYFGINTIQVN